MQKDKHLILTSGRSGSNFLTETLDLHPEIVNYGEVLGAWTILYKLFGGRKTLFPSAADYLRWVYSSRTLFYSRQIYYVLRGKLKKVKSYKKIKTIGIKEFMLNFQRRECCNFLENRKDLFMIYLVRMNKLQTYMSLLYAKESNIWDSREKNNKIIKSKINVEKMIEKIKSMENDEEVLNNYYKKYKGPKMKIEYSNYFKNEKSIQYFNRKIFKFLQVKNIIIRCRHKKILPIKLKDKIGNYEEVKQALIGSNAEKYLGENLF